MGQVSSTCWQDAPIVKEKNPNRLADAQKKLQTCARALRNRMVSWMGNHWWGTGGHKGVGSFAMKIKNLTLVHPNVWFQILQFYAKKLAIDVFSCETLEARNNYIFNNTVFFYTLEITYVLLISRYFRWCLIQSSDLVGIHRLHFSTAFRYLRPKNSPMFGRRRRQSSTCRR